MEEHSQLLRLLEQAQAAQLHHMPLPVDALVLALRRLLAQGAPPQTQPELYERLKSLQEWLRQNPPSQAGVTEEQLWTLGDLLERVLRALGFARRLAELRERQGLSVPDLADRAGVDRSLVYKLLKGAHAPPSAETVRRLATALGVSPHQLMPPGTPTRQPRLTPVLSALAGAVFGPAAAMVPWVLDRFVQDYLKGVQGILERYVVVPRDLPGAEVLQTLARVLASDPPPLRERRLRLLSLLAQPGEEGVKALEACAPPQTGTGSADEAP